MTIKIIGRWDDKVRKVGSNVWTPGLNGEFAWGYNQIQNTFAELLAAWCRMESGYDRIGFMGIGSGLVGWDATPPAQPYATATLTTEYFRKTIPQVDIVFIDKTTNIPTGGTVSSKIEITVTLASADANGTMREFGLFGGTATSALDSGEMINWIIHSRIVKDVSLEIQRKVRLEFQTL